MKLVLESINPAVKADDVDEATRAQFEAAVRIIGSAMRTIADLDLPVAVVANVLVNEAARSIAQMGHERRQHAVTVTETHFGALVRRHRMRMQIPGEAGHG